MRRFRPISTLIAFAMLAGCSGGTVARGEEAAMPSDPQPLHHARRTSSGAFENNYSNEPRGSVWKWRWERWTQDLPKPPANGYHFSMAHSDVAWLKANRSVDTLTWIGHATALADQGRQHSVRSAVLGAHIAGFVRGTEAKDAA